MILDAIPGRARRALDVGCGEGTLAHQLRAVVPDVTGIDADPGSIALARGHEGGGHVDYLLGDFLTHPFEPGSFDVVVSVVMLHHMDAGVALARMRDLLRPGGTLLTVGLARARLPGDLPVVLAGVVASRWYGLTRTRWEHPSPTVWPPPQTFAEMRGIADRALPAFATVAISSGATR